MSIAAEKKRAEVASDEAWSSLCSEMERYLLGDISVNALEFTWQDFKLAHNTERGLRHEKED